ncbi:hypothetical protein HYH03_016934, partial [Edaphochlamys debaryana]
MSTIWTTLGGALQPVLGLAERIVPKGPPRPVQLPARVRAQPPTPPDRVNAIVDQLYGKKADWARLSCSGRAKLLRKCMDCLLQVEEELASASAEAKGSYGSGIGEERTALLPIMFALGEYCGALAAGGSPRPLGVRQRPDGQLVATVLPIGPVGLLLPNFRGEVWIEPGKAASQGAYYRR